MMSSKWKTETIDRTRERLKRQWGDYPLTILIINPINLRLVRMVGRTSITPNQLSIFSFFLTAASALCMASIEHWIQAIGGGLLLAGYIIDCLDGDLARLKNLKSPLGAMLDPILNRCGEIVIISGISINGWRLTGDPIWLLGGLFLLSASQLYFYITDAMLNIYRKKTDRLKNTKKKMLFGTPVRFGTIEPFIWGQACLAFSGLSHLGIIIFGIMFTIACILQFYRLFTTARDPKLNGSDEFEIHVW
jgi:phosphatidylglycerophosphate synthase